MKEPLPRRLLWGGYNLLLGGLGLAASPYLLYRVAVTPRWRVGWDERVALVLPPAPAGAPSIWIHAVSVGEVTAVSPLVMRLRERYPHATLYLSTVTETGKETALEKVGRFIDHHLFLPLDWSPMVNRVTRRVKPDLMLVMETEIWPNLYRAVKVGGGRVMTVNGRISPSSFGGYSRIAPLFRRVLNYVDIMALQSAGDAARLLSLGAPVNKVIATGNLKYDQAITQLEGVDPKRVREDFRLGEEEEVLVAGSTHPGEEEIVLDAFKSLQEGHPGLVLLLAPRHPRRREEVETLLREKGLPWVRRTCIDERRGERVILLDTVGELAAAYSMARVAFIGGSLVDKGGHNPLEPAFFKVPIVMGDSHYNFRDMLNTMLERRGVLITSAHNLHKDLAYFLSHPSEAADMGEAAHRVLLENRGALERHMQLIESLL